MSKNGLHLITPTSIVSTGTGNSSSINANGSVTFSTCATLSLNGVFSADYDNYMIVMRHVGSDASAFNVDLRLRLSGTDANGSNYTTQGLGATGTTVDGGGGRSSNLTLARISSTNNTLRSGLVLHVYGPNLAQPTAFRSLTVEGYDNARIIDYAGTHSVSTGYDGLTLSRPVGSFSGLVGVYGMRK